MNRALRGQGAGDRGQGAEGQDLKPEDLETPELLKVVGEGLKAAVAGFEELEKRSGAKDDSADVERRTQKLGA